MKQLKVIILEDSPNSGFGYYKRKDIGYVVGYVNDCAVVILENGKFARVPLTKIQLFENFYRNNKYE